MSGNSRLRQESTQSNFSVTMKIKMKNTKDQSVGITIIDAPLPKSPDLT
jgi:hypothetical protein